VSGRLNRKKTALRPAVADDQPTLPPELDPADEVTISTIDNHIYCRLFGADEAIL
jgi:hypothetical protein